MHINTSVVIRVDSEDEEIMAEVKYKAEGTKRGAGRAYQGSGS